MVWCQCKEQTTMWKLLKLTIDKIAHKIILNNFAPRLSESLFQKHGLILIPA